MRRVFNITEIRPIPTLLDCNGHLLEPDKVEYCNRFQSSLPHTITSITLKDKIMKTVGGIEYIKPWAYCKIRYYRDDGTYHENSAQFESLFVEKGVYVFPQVIPVGHEMEFEYEWCNNMSYIEQLKKHITKDGTA